MVLRREASVRHHLVAKALVLLSKSHGFMRGGGHGWIRVYFFSAQCENGHMLIYLSKTMCEIASGSKSVGFT